MVKYSVKDLDTGKLVIDCTHGAVCFSAFTYGFDIMLTEKKSKSGNFEFCYFYTSKYVDTIEKIFIPMLKGVGFEFDYKIEGDKITYSFTQTKDKTGYWSAVLLCLLRYPFEQLTLYNTFIGSIGTKDKNGVEIDPFYLFQLAHTNSYFQSNHSVLSNYEDEGRIVLNYLMPKSHLQERITKDVRFYRMVESFSNKIGQKNTEIVSQNPSESYEQLKYSEFDY